MKYPLLSSIFYQDYDKYRYEYENRINSPYCLSIPLSIKNFPAFVMMTTDIYEKTESIYQKNLTLSSLVNSAPNVAIKKMVANNLIEEIMLTNDLEGVYSTRKEIQDILENPKDTEKTKRLRGLTLKYQRLLKNESFSIKTCDDIRQLYNEIVLDEFDPTDKPDGEQFRKENVSIQTVTQKEKHKGLYPESTIQSELTKALNFMNDTSYPFLIRLGVFHYLFGYIHPFYDGNGRTIRFISSYMLKESLNSPIAFRLSYEIKNQKSQYYKAFDLCNDAKNKGDLTPFVEMFLSVIENAIISLIDKLTTSSEKMTFYKKRIKELSQLSDVQQQLLWILVQNKLFAPEGIWIEELCEIFSKSRNVIKSELLSLSEFLDIKMQGRRKLYTIKLEKLE